MLFCSRSAITAWFTSLSVSLAFALQHRKALSRCRGDRVSLAHEDLDNVTMPFQVKINR